MQISKVLCGLLVILLLISCNQDDLFYENLKIIEIGEYTFQAPNNFDLIEQQGYDSSVGKIKGSGITLFFDYGIYTSKEQNVSEENYIIVDDIHNGIDRQLLIAKNPQKDNTTIHVSIMDNSEVSNMPALKI